jgi:hypothetical protein
MTTIRNGSNGSKLFDPTVRECRVCIHAGKPYAECITHWVKDRSGNITCPTLLNQKCLVCGTCGHTASYCKSKIGGEATPADAIASSTKPMKPPTKPAQVAQSIPRPASSNRYALLGLIEEEQDNAREKSIAMFPTLVVQVPVPVPEMKPVITRPAAQTVQAPVQATCAISWAKRLSSPPPPPQQLISVKCHGRDKGVSVKVSWADEAE